MQMSFCDLPVSSSGQMTSVAQIQLKLQSVNKVEGTFSDISIDNRKPWKSSGL